MIDIGIPRLIPNGYNEMYRWWTGNFTFVLAEWVGQQEFAVFVFHKNTTMPVGKRVVGQVLPNGDFKLKTN